MKNIILITIDSLRYDHSKIIKDSMNQFLGSGIDFQNAFSTGPSSSMSYIGLLCSKCPTFPDEKDSILQHNKKNRKRTLLYEILKNNGFRTYVIANCMIHRYCGYDKGIDVLIDHTESPKRNMIKEVMSSKKMPVFLQKRIKSLKVIVSGMKKENRIPYFDARKVTEMVRDILDKNNHSNSNNMFMHINYLDTHTPPNMSNEYIRRDFSKKEIFKSKFGIKEITSIRKVLDKVENNDKELQEVKDRMNAYQKMYYSETLYIAEHINNLLKYCDKTGKLEDAIFILTSDHGEYLWPEGKLLGHGQPIQDKEDALNVFYDNLVHVPLVIWGLGEKKVDKMVSLVDLSPTILEMIGVEKPAEWYGDSLFSDKQKPVISEDVRHGYTCYCVRTSEWVFAYNEDTKQEYLFKRSPEEKMDVSGERPEIVKQMYELLENHKNHKNECCREYLRKDIKLILNKGNEND